MLSIGTAAYLSGVHVETIRFYEREGVVPRPARSRSGRRLYTTDDVVRLRFVRRCRKFGFPLAHIREMLDLASYRDAPCAKVRAICERRLLDVRRERDEFVALERDLRRMLRLCGDADADCRLLDALLGDNDPSAAPD